MNRFLFIGHRWPEPQSSAAGTRTRQLIEYVRGFATEIHFACSAQPTSFSDNLEESLTSTSTISPNSSSFDNFLKKLQPDAVIFDRFMTEEMFGWRVREVCPKALRILDTQDLHFLRKARRKKKGFSGNLSRSKLQTSLAKREVASIFRCDLNLIISEFECELLREKMQVPASILCYWPLFQPQLSTKSLTKLSSFENRHDFMFIGNFQHPPNWDSVQFSLQKTWPSLSEKLPGAEFHIYGAYPPASLKNRTWGKDRVFVHGRVEDADQAMQKHRVLLAPLRFGAGLKGKLLKAMHNGLPSITSPIGSEGIVNKKNWPGFVIESKSEIIEKSVELYQNPQVWAKAKESGIRILTKKFNTAEFEGNLQKEIENRQKNLNLHRQDNFVGQLLHHHQHQSTKFMSRWIEEKHKWASL